MTKHLSGQISEARRSILDGAKQLDAVLEVLPRRKEPENPAEIRLRIFFEILALMRKPRVAFALFSTDTGWRLELEGQAYNGSDLDGLICQAMRQLRGED